MNLTDQYAGSDDSPQASRGADPLQPLQASGLDCGVADEEAQTVLQPRTSFIDSGGSNSRGTEILRPVAPGLPEFVGRFRVIEEIAHGAMGVILKAWDPDLGRCVALKLLHEHFQMDDELIRRFNAEACISGRLEHPAIVSIHEVGRCANGRPFFSMRLVEGTTLARLLARPRNLESMQLKFLRMFEKICQGVAYAHSRSVIHRDLKPSNIVIGKFGVVKIMDWGLAKYVRHREEPGIPALDGHPAAWRSLSGCDSDGTACGTVLGTPAYLPPEQARGEADRVDERADVFSLGGILCHILTGAPPYTGDDASKLDQAVHECLAPAFARLEACPAEREPVNLALHCLSPNPENRPRNGNEVAAAITGYLESDQHRTERDLVRFFEQSLDLFCIASLDGYFRRVNPNFPRLLGYPEAELLSRPFSEFIHPDDLVATADAMSCLLIGLPVVRFTNRYIHADGHHLYLEWMARTESESGNIYAVARDVTQRETGIRG